VHPSGEEEPVEGHDVEGERGHSGSHTLSRDLQMEQKSTTWQLADGPELRIGVCLSAV